MDDIRIPYGPRRSELAALVAKRNKGKKKGKRIDPNQPRAALMAALGMKLKPVAGTPG